MDHCTFPQNLQFCFSDSLYADTIISEPNTWLNLGNKLWTPLPSDPCPLFRHQGSMQLFVWSKENIMLCAPLMYLLSEKIQIWPPHFPNPLLMPSWGDPKNFHSWNYTKSINMNYSLTITSKSLIMDSTILTFKSS